MNEYHKIQTVFKRNPATNFKTLLLDEFSLPEFEYLKDNDWVFTEKVDGTNIRVMWSQGQVSFGGKTDKANTPPFLLDKLTEIFQGVAFQELFNEQEVCLYGEGYGPKIQKGGGNYRSDVSFILFDIRIGQWWLKREDIEQIAHKMGIDVVPIIGHGKLDDLVSKVSKGFLSFWGNFHAEGIVARPSVELKARSGERIITKLKHKDFA